MINYFIVTAAFLGGTLKVEFKENITNVDIVSEKIPTISGVDVYVQGNIKNSNIVHITLADKDQFYGYSIYATKDLFNMIQSSMT